MLENKLKMIRKKNKVTQLELADSVLTTRQTIYGIEQGKSIPSLELALKIANVFNLKVEDIFRIKESHLHKKRSDLFTVF